MMETGELVTVSLEDRFEESAPGELRHPDCPLEAAEEVTRE